MFTDLKWLKNHGTEERLSGHQGVERGLSRTPELMVCCLNQKEGRGRIGAGDH
jgi:hypothetical protein